MLPWGFTTLNLNDNTVNNMATNGSEIATPDWVADAVFYQIFPDRFARRDSLNAHLPLEPWESPPTPHGFKGGDLFGIVDRLDSLKDLGITAIYLTPIFASASNHRYHTYDFFRVDPMLGGDAALRELIDECHTRDIRIVLDGVFNHASRGFWQFHHVMENGVDSPYRDWFYFDPSRLSGEEPFVPYPDRETQEQLKQGAGSLEAVGYSAWWSLPALPKFNVRTPAVREFLLSVGEHWMKFGIDGWRLDVPHEIKDVTFWREFRSRVRAINPQAYIVGEVWGEAKRWLKGDMWDAVMNYQLTAACLGFFGADHLDLELARRPSSFRHLKRLDAATFDQEVSRVGSLYDRRIQQSQLNLLDSHDMPRFLSCVNDHEPSLRMAWLFMCSVPGAPCVYYGDEVGLKGLQDPDCRRSFPTDESAWNDSLRDWYVSCIQLRKDHRALRHGTRSTLAATDRCYAALHSLDDDHVICAFNAGDETAKLDLRTLPAELSGSQFDSVLHTGDADVSTDTVTLGPWSVVVLVRSR